MPRRHAPPNPKARRPEKAGANMQLGDQQASSNVGDRRGMRIGGGLGVGGLLIAVIAYFLGFDPRTILNVAEQGAPQADTRETPKGRPAGGKGQVLPKVSA